MRHALPFRRPAGAGVRRCASAWTRPSLAHSRTHALLVLLLLCAAAPAWAQAEEGQPEVPVAARELARGVELTAEDVAFAPAGSLAPSGAEPARLGWVTRRVIRAGEPLRAPAVAPPTLVQAGQTVQAVWSRGAVELRLTGRALGAAREGERVVVRVDTRRRVEGIAVGPALVRVTESR